MKIVLGLFIIAHGLMHASYLTPKPQDPKYPFYFDKGWFADLVGASAKPIGTALVLLTVVCLAIAGLGLIGLPVSAGLWKISLIVGSVASLLVLILFWHTWLVLGIIINIALLYSVTMLDFKAN